MSAGSMLLTGVPWFLSSALLSTWANTAFLQTFKDPSLHIFVRFVGAACVSTAGCIASKEFSSMEEFVDVLRAVAYPAALLWVANYANSVSLAMSGITLTYVVKACM
jgi:hypothetical protein